MATPLQKRKLMGEINVVPYIDVMLVVLLVIFMVTAPLLTQGIEVDLPKAGAEPIEDVPNSPPLVLSVDASEGNLYINVGDDEDKPTKPRRSTLRRTSASCCVRARRRRFLVKADRAMCRTAMS